MKYLFVYHKYSDLKKKLFYNILITAFRGNELSIYYPDNLICGNYRLIFLSLTILNNFEKRIKNRISN